MWPQIGHDPQVENFYKMSDNPPSIALINLQAQLLFRNQFSKEMVDPFSS